MDKCVMCNDGSILKYFKVNIRKNGKWEEINDIHLCKKCGLKLFGEEAEIIWSDNNG